MIIDRIMKTNSIILVIIFSTVFAFSSCEGNSPESSSLITVTGETTPKAITFTKETVSDVGSVVFTGNDISWFNPDTREIKFRKSFNPYNLKVYQNLHFYLDGKQLFTVNSYVMPIHSFAVNDLVLYIESNGRYYLRDCYPASIMESDPTVSENKEKRAVAWDKFINQLKNERKIKR